MVSFGSQISDTSNKHVVNWMWQICLWNWRHHILFSFFISSSVQGLLLYTLYLNKPHK